MNPYHVDQWHDFFLATAGAAAALTGLLFVALSLHIAFVATDPVYRSMARGSLIGLVTVLVLSVVALIPQPTLWLGLELTILGVAYIAIVVPLAWAFQRTATRSTRTTSRRSALARTGAGYLLALVDVLGGLSVTLQIGPGLFVVALIVIALLLWNLWDAWVLLMGVADEEIAQGKSTPIG
jgi:modulator of FtsH protease